jgi:hypothetical protein
VARARVKDKETWCPRCGDKWEDMDNIRVSGCGLRWRPHFDEYSLSFGIDHIDTNHDTLYWDEDVLCRFYRAGSYMGIDLPWLPFTITKEDLEKYLVLI